MQKKIQILLILILVPIVFKLIACNNGNNASASKNRGDSTKINTLALSATLHFLAENKSANTSMITSSQKPIIQLHFNNQLDIQTITTTNINLSCGPYTENLSTLIINEKNTTVSFYPISQLPNSTACTLILHNITANNGTLNLPNNIQKLSFAIGNNTNYTNSEIALINIESGSTINTTAPLFTFITNTPATITNAQPYIALSLTANNIPVTNSPNCYYQSNNTQPMSKYNIIICQLAQPDINMTNLLTANTNYSVSITYNPTATSTSSNNIYSQITTFKSGNDPIPKVEFFSFPNNTTGVNSNTNSLLVLFSLPVVLDISEENFTDIQGSFITPVVSEISISLNMQLRNIFVLRLTPMHTQSVLFTKNDLYKITFNNVKSESSQPGNAAYNSQNLDTTSLYFQIGNQ